MAVESLVLAVALVGLSKLVDLGFASLERARGADPGAAAAAAEPPGRTPDRLPRGGGLRGGAVPPPAGAALASRLLRLMQAPAVLASTLAVTASALLFSLAHHAGTPGEAFTWFAFIFRWLAGVYFAWVFVVRGFGIAVGTHAAYDILVGWLGWHL